MNALQDIITNMATATPQPEDYTGEDGLIYCGKCRTPKQRYFPEGKALLGIDRHPTECECQKAQRIEREAAEARRKHLDTVADLKRNCFSDREMEKRCFANDNGKTPQMEYAHRYVEHWEQMKAENIGYYLWGDTDSGKSYLAACIANALTEKEISVRMTNFPTILNDLGASFEGRNEYIERLCRFPLLIIDDLGTEMQSQFTVSCLYNLVNTRLISEKSMIISTNIRKEELLSKYTDRITSRLFGEFEICVFSGKDIRSQKLLRGS